MKKLILFAGIAIITAYTSAIFAQDNCKVLMPGIGDTYTGSCKKGFADGQGEASGIDQYKGQFKKGLPNGTGTYIWQTGESYTGGWKMGLREGHGKYVFKSQGRDSVISGMWKGDKFIGENPPAPYVIEYRNSIGRVSCIKVGERPYVKYVFSRNGSESNNISDLLLQGSSGSERMNSSFTGFEQVTFPFTGKVSFKAPNSWMSATITCELRLVINEPASWVVTMFY